MEFFDQLAKAIGPVGAVFAIAAGYFYLRIVALQDKIMAAFIADTEYKANLVNTLGNLKDVVEKFIENGK